MRASWTWEPCVQEHCLDLRGSNKKTYSLNQMPSSGGFPFGNISKFRVNTSKIVDIPIKHPFMMDMLIFSQDVVMLRSRRSPGNQQSLWASKPTVEPVVAPHTPGTFEGSQRINIEVTKIHLPPSNVAVMYIMTRNNPVKFVFFYIGLWFSSDLQA